MFHLSTTKPGMYCRKCGYQLVGLSENRCPECGRVFDPNNPRTFRKKPPLGWLAKILRTVAISLILLAVAAGWYWRQCRIQRQIVSQLQAAGMTCMTKVTGLPFLAEWAIRHGLPALEKVDLVIATAASDDDLNHLAGLSDLPSLRLDHSKVTDAGLARLKDMTHLSNLHLEWTQVTGTGLARVHGLQALTWLYMEHTPLTDEGLSNIGKMTSLKVLYLGATKITDAGLAHLEGLANLEELSLFETQVTDKGLAHLKGLRNLQRLNLAGTHVTYEGVQDLKRSLPSVSEFPPLKMISRSSQ